MSSGCGCCCCGCCSGSGCCCSCHLRVVVVVVVVVNCGTHNVGVVRSVEVHDKNVEIDEHPGAPSYRAYRPSIRMHTDAAPVFPLKHLNYLDALAVDDIDGGDDVSIDQTNFLAGIQRDRVDLAFDLQLEEKRHEQCSNLGSSMPTSMVTTNDGTPVTISNTTMSEQC